MGSQPKQCYHFAFLGIRQMLRSLRHQLVVMFYRIAAKGWLPASWFEPNLPPPSERSAKQGRIAVEIVSHCWQYSHFLAYQLSSLVRYPPESVDVTMTVFYCPEDKGTAELLAFFGQHEVSSVTWNWWPLPRTELFRRGIGRNRAALATQADWVWFTDCDVMFREECLDTLGAQLQGRQEALVFPREERVTELLAEDNPMLKAGASPGILDVDTSVFTSKYPSRATGPLQIAHADVCRAVGYCNAIPVYQEPANAFAKCHEDRAFRWLIQSQGVAVEVPEVYRIRHVVKGRYAGSEANTRVRTVIRRCQEIWRN